MAVETTQSSVLVNFVDSSKKGFGPLHRKLMTTTYSDFLNSLEVTDIPLLLSQGEVITVVYRSHKVRRLGVGNIQIVFDRLKKFCKDTDVKDVLLPLHPLVRDGTDLELLQMIVYRTFNDTNIKVVIG